MPNFKPEQRKLFEGSNFVTVSTLGKDGTPRSTTTWVDIEGEDILINGAKSRKWLANLRRNPNVALSIFDLKNPYNRVSVIGEVTEITREGAEEHIDKLARKYTGNDYTDHQTEDPRQIVRVRVNKIIG
ncbi:MAG: TIGR03618 family F420-dependent PPOX class oxidoreductase [Chloroflexota bacterium]|nr:TIGR03618 family F420-dependent PPOX class oxidoreductase [Chloroflexota bacterium]